MGQTFSETPSMIYADTFSLLFAVVGKPVCITKILRKLFLKKKLKKRKKKRIPHFGWGIISCDCFELWVIYFMIMRYFLNKITFINKAMNSRWPRYIFDYFYEPFFVHFCFCAKDVKVVLLVYDLVRSHVRRHEVYVQHTNKTEI